jgi:tetratricopeptide (TPR) repeat protein
MSDEREFELALQQNNALARRATAPDQKIRFQVGAAEVTRQLNRSDEAKKQLQLIWSRLRPGRWIYRDVRDRLEAEFLDRNDYDGLIKFYEKQVEKSPDDLASLVRLGKLQLADERFRQARRSLEKVIDRAPDDLSARLVLIDVLARSGSVSETAQHFEKLIELDPNNPDHFIMWGQTILADPDTEIAKRHLAASKVWKRLSASRPRDAVLLARVGKLYASINQVDEAILMHQKAIEAAPDSPLYRELLGEYLHRIKRSKQALRVWRSMAQGERHDRDSLVRLAEVLSTFKFGGQSLEVWQDASTFDLTLDQRLRYSRYLSDSLKHREAIDQLEIASGIAESPDERERVLHDRVALYQAARMLRPKIAEVKDQPPTSQNLRLLALLYQADGQLVQASVTNDFKIHPRQFGQPRR